MQIAAGAFAVLFAAGSVLGAPTVADTTSGLVKLEKLRQAAATRDAAFKAITAFESEYRVKTDGTTEPVRCRLYECSLDLPQGSELREIKLPPNRRLRLFGILLKRADGSEVAVDLKPACNLLGLGVAGKPGAALDGRQSNYPAEYLAPAAARLGTGGAHYKVLTAIDEPNVAEPKNQVIRVKAGSYDKVCILATSVGGATQAKLAFRVRPSGQIKAETFERAIEIPDWCPPEAQGARPPYGSLQDIAEVVEHFTEARRVPIPKLRAQLSPGATIKSGNPEAAMAGFTWDGEKTETTFSASLNVPTLLPGADYNDGKVYVYAGADDKGAILINGRLAADFYWGDGKALIVSGERPRKPVDVQIIGRNETGSGKLLLADVGIEYPAMQAYAQMLRELVLADVVAGNSPEARALFSKVTELVLANLPLEALMNKNMGQITQAGKNLRQQLQPVSVYAKARKFDLVGYAHIDLAWLWPFSETIESVVPLTFVQALKFMKEYPDFHFSMTQAQQYYWVEQLFPDMFREIRQRVGQGRWELLGGMWTEPDCNLPNGESYVRQILLGKSYFGQQFSRDVRIACNPDSFGYNWQLPQIFRKTGFDAFITQKISWNDTWQFPYRLFWWESPDGSRLLSYFPPGGYAHQLNLHQMMEEMHDFEKETSGVRDAMLVYGVGDHGGGPTRAMIERGKQVQASAFLPQAQMTTAQAYFDDLQKDRFIPGFDGYAKASTAQEQLPVWSDDLYLEKHRGTYTTHADVKDGNRRSERMLYSAETAATLAFAGPGGEKAAPSSWKETPQDALAIAAMGGPPAVHPVEPATVLWRGLYSVLPDEIGYPAAALRQAWRDTCVLQMHDILPGSGISQNYREAERMHRDLQTTAGLIGLTALQRLAGSGNATTTAPQGLYVFNLLPWERTAIARVKLPEGKVLATADGKSVPVQRDSQSTGTFLAEVRVPACGYAVTSWIDGKVADPSETDGSVLENKWLKATVDAHTGNLSSLVLKSTGREMIGEYTTATRILPNSTARPEHIEDGSLTPASAGLQANIIQLHRDYPLEYDAWDTGLTGYMDELSTSVQVSKLTSGPVYSEISVTKPYANSIFRQTYRIYPGLPWLEVLNDVDWHERHMMVKAAVPLSIKNKWANYEIPFGAINRPAIREAKSEIGKYEHSGIQWGNIDDPSGTAGFSILTMNKYGFDARDNVLRISLLRAPSSPNEKADVGKPLTDEGHHQFSYALFPHQGTWEQADLARKGYEYNQCVIPVTGPGAQQETSKSLVRLEPSNVIMSTMKKAEDGKGIIVRLYEAQGTSVSQARLELPWKPERVESCDMIERMDTPAARAQAPAKVDGNAIVFPINKFEVVTYRIRF